MKQGTKDDMKTAVVIYHSKDMDGQASGAVTCLALRKLGYSVTAYGHDYGEEIFYPIADAVYMVDITFSIAEMNEYVDALERNGGGGITVIDHHRSFFEKYCEIVNPKFKLIYSVNQSACLACWDHFNEEEPPIILKAIDIWDIHKKEFDPFAQVKTFSDAYMINLSLRAGLVKDELNLREWGNILKTRSLASHIERGTAMDQQILFDANMQYEEVAEIEGRQFVCVNTPPNKHIIDRNILPVCFYWKVGKNRWKYSLRSKSDEVVSVAKALGGGGHDLACGFETEHCMF